MLALTLDLDWDDEEMGTEPEEEEEEVASIVLGTILEPMHLPLTLLL
jgi:hypothetical protein